MTVSSMPADATRMKDLSTLKLPTLPPGTAFLMESLTNEEIDFTELAGVLEKFPGIAAKLISLANSVWSAPSSAITSLEASCSRLGFGVVRSTSIALAVAAPFDAARCASFDPEYFWCSALLTAEASSALSQHGDADSLTARTAGLLHNLGLLWLVDRLPDELDHALDPVENSKQDCLRSALMRILGFDQAEAGGYLARAWDLPEPLSLTMAHYLDLDYHGLHKNLVNTVGLAVKLVSSIVDDEPRPEPDARLHDLGIAKQDYYRNHEQLSAQLDKIRAVAQVLI